MYRRLSKTLSAIEPALASAARGGIRVWQATRFLRPQSCRFYPTCSEYMLGCIEEHGAFRGFSLGLARIAKCHPLHAGGIDEVPAAKTRSVVAASHAAFRP